ncbi:MAG: transcriptional repressor [Gammaproteobacteria bacterium]|nr:transcriptional repressor [Gammaproteobacteria bacterium]
MSKASQLNTKRLLALFSERDIAPTPQRLELARVMLAKPQHLSADQLHARVNAKGISVSMATVYNTLRLFSERNLVREVVVDPNRVFYDSNVAAHHHFYNLDTGELSDIPDSKVIIGKLPRMSRGQEIAAVDVVLKVREKQK